MNRRSLLAALAALPFVRPAAAATVQDIHVLRPVHIEMQEDFGVIKAAMVDFADFDHASLIGKTYGFYGTPLTCTREMHAGDYPGANLPPYIAIFVEINL